MLGIEKICLKISFIRGWNTSFNYEDNIFSRSNIKYNNIKKGLDI